MNRLKNIAQVALITSLILFHGCSFYKPLVKNHKWEKPFTFIQMTDPQFGMASKNKGFELETKLFEEAISAANKLNPSFVVISGDLINKDGDKEQEAEFYRISKKLNKKIPLYLLPGNHDVNKDPTSETIKEYRKNFGKDYYTFTNNGCYFIVLNSTIFQNSEYCKEEESKQLKWLNKVLQKTDKYQQSFVIMHHSLFLKMPDEPDQYFNIPLETRMKYLELFRKANISAIFSGHYHQNSYGKYGNMEVITCCSIGVPFANDPSGFNIVNVSKNKIDFEYQALEEKKIP